MRRPGWLFAICAIALGCGEKATPTPSYAVNSSEPAARSAKADRRVIFPGAIQSMGRTLEGEILVAAAGRLFRIDGTSSIPVPVDAAPGQPTPVGTIRAISPRAEGGAWVAAEGGLFVAEGEALKAARIASPPSPSAIVHATTGTLAGVWLGASEGLFRVRNDASQQITITGWEGPVDSVTLEETASNGFVRINGALMLLSTEDDELRATPPPDELPRPGVIAGGEAALFAVIDRGLLRWRGSDTPVWTRFTFLPEGARNGTALAHDANSNVLWMRTEDRLIRIQGDSLAAIPVPTLGANELGHLAVEPGGKVWVSDGVDAVRYEVNGE